MMKKKIIPISLFLLVTVVPLALGKFVVPMDWYAFRVWETLVDNRQRDLGKTPFYPHQHKQRSEVGLLGVHTPYAIKKDVEWYTDGYGYRNREMNDEGLDIVLVGDSTSVGAGLTQDQMLASVLSRELDTQVYTYAPAAFPLFLQDKVFREKHKPKWVVYLISTRMAKNVITSREFDDFVRQENLIKKFLRKLPESWQIDIDRWANKPWINRHIIHNLIWQKWIKPFGIEHQYYDDASGHLFFERDFEEEMMWLKHPEKMSQVQAILHSYNEAAEKYNMNFLFVMTPSKETIFWERLKANNHQQYPRPSFVAYHLSKNLQDQGVMTVDVTTAFLDQRFKKRKRVYQLDDDHWNAYGVEVVADLIAEKIRKND